MERIYWRRDGDTYRASVPNRVAVVFPCLDGWCYLLEQFDDGQMTRSIHGGTYPERQDAMLAAERELRR